MHIEHNASLLPHNTFGMNVKTNMLVAYDNEEELINIIQNLRDKLVRPILHIGEGSNLLFMNDFPGTVLFSNIKTTKILHKDEHEVLVRVGAGWNMDEFISYAIEHGWYGLENLSKIPGQVGASAVQNIGAYGVEAGNFIHAVNCVSLQDGTRKTFYHKDCNFSYRHSIFKESDIRGMYAVTSVEYNLQINFTPHLDYGGIRSILASKDIDSNTISANELREIIIYIRDNKLPDPKVQGNAGSFFMNPVVDKKTFESILADYPDIPRYELNEDQIKIPAAWLIEQCGWKGRALGRAGVHERQPLVLVNLGNATGEEIKQLSNKIREDVMSKFGIEILPEVNFI